MAKIIITILLVAALALGGFFWYRSTSQKSLPPPPITNTPAAPKVESLSPIFSYLSAWAPAATWKAPTKTTETSFYGKLSGMEATGEITGKNPSISRHFEDQKVMASLGFIEDINLAADGPGASNWGYRKTENGQSQVVIFGYSTNVLLGPDSKSPPFVNLSVFVSDPFTQK